MTRRTAPLLTSAALLSAAEALASPPCDGPSVDVDAHVTPLWQREIVEVIQRMRRLPDIDRCARVAVTPVGPDLRVEVTLSDGRVTLRAVRDPGELRAWIVPLLIVLSSVDDRGHCEACDEVVTRAEDTETLSAGRPCVSVRRFA